jgi:hypothetical protein
VTYIAILYMVLGQIPHPLVSVAENGGMGLLIKLLLLINCYDFLLHGFHIMCLHLKVSVFAH